MRFYILYLFVINVVLTVLYPFLVAGFQKISEKPNQLPLIEDMRKHVIWGCFYSNPDDPRGWVPKLSGVGKTINFRNRKQIITFVVLLISTLSLGIIWAIEVVSHVQLPTAIGQ